MTLKLLVADDSITIQKIIGLAFSAEDAMVKSVSSGDAAIEAVRTFKPDVVLADVFMPGYNGYEVCESIKNDPELASTPVVLLVGTFEPFDESEASRVRCDAHLTKPLDASEMIETVRSLAGDKMMPQNGETPDYSPAENMQSSMPSNSDVTCTRVRNLKNPGVWDSYLSDSSVLEIFDQETRTAVRALALVKGGQPCVNEYPSIPDTKNLEDADPLSEKLLSVIVDRIVRKISPDIIREVAWDVVPELSEILIRRVIQERDQS
jgi:CheY-like chemotaxis protein